MSKDRSEMTPAEKRADTIAKQAEHVAAQAAAQEAAAQEAAAQAEADELLSNPALAHSRGMEACDAWGETKARAESVTSTIALTIAAELHNAKDDEAKKAINRAYEARLMRSYVHARRETLRGDPAAFDVIRATPAKEMGAKLMALDAAPSNEKGFYDVFAKSAFDLSRNLLSQARKQAGIKSDGSPLEKKAHETKAETPAAAQDKPEDKASESAADVLKSGGDIGAALNAVNDAELVSALLHRAPSALLRIIEDVASKYVATSGQVAHAKLSGDTAATLQRIGEAAFAEAARLEREAKIAKDKADALAAEKAAEDAILAELAAKDAAKANAA